MTDWLDKFKENAKMVESFREIKKLIIDWVRVIRKSGMNIDEAKLLVSGIMATQSMGGLVPVMMLWVDGVYQEEEPLDD